VNLLQFLLSQESFQTNWTQQNVNETIKQIEMRIWREKKERDRDRHKDR
jgi:hypothetical protein